MTGRRDLLPVKDTHILFKFRAGACFPPPVLKPYQSNIRTTRSQVRMHVHMHAHACARILFYFLNSSTLSIHPYATTSPHAHIYQNYTSHPRTVALLGCQLPRRRHAATISAQIYYTPTLDSVIVCGHRPRTGWSHSQQQIEYALRFYSFYRRANRERTYKFHLHPTFEVCQRGSYFHFRRALSRLRGRTSVERIDAACASNVCMPT